MSVAEVNTASVSLEQMRLKRDIVSMEAMAVVSGIGNTVARLTGLMHDAVQYLKPGMGEETVLTFDKTTPKSLQGILTAKPYVTLRDKQIVTPPGLSENFVTYAGLLSQMAEFYAGMGKSVLEPFNTWLGRQIGEPAMLEAQTQLPSLPQSYLNQSEQFIKKAKACFTGHAQAQLTEQPYGRFFSANGDWNRIYQHLDSISRSLDKRTLEANRQLLDTVRDRLDTLTQRLTTDPTKYKPSSGAIRALADQCYVIATVVEAYAQLRMRVREFQVAVEATTARLKDS